MKTTMEILIPGKPAKVQEIELSAEPSFDELSEVLAPWFGRLQFEHVSCLSPDGKSQWDMFVDENGHAKRLEYNHLAHCHYGRNAIKRGMVKTLDEVAEIVGPAVVFHRRVWF